MIELSLNKPLLSVWLSFLFEYHITLWEDQNRTINCELVCIRDTVLQDKNYGNIPNRLHMACCGGVIWLLMLIFLFQDISIYFTNMIDQRILYHEMDCYCYSSRRYHTVCRMYLDQPIGTRIIDTRDNITDRRSEDDYSKHDRYMVRECNRAFNGQRVRRKFSNEV